MAKHGPASAAFQQVTKGKNGHPTEKRPLSVVPPALLHSRVGTHDTLYPGAGFRQVQPYSTSQTSEPLRTGTCGFHMIAEPRRGPAHLTTSSPAASIAAALNQGQGRSQLPAHGVLSILPDEIMPVRMGVVFCGLRRQDLLVSSARLGKGNLCRLVEMIASVDSYARAKAISFIQSKGRADRRKVTGLPCRNWSGT